MVTGPAAEWLLSRREDLNARFERMRRRYPRLDPAAFAAELEATLPALAEPAPGSQELLSALYDLLLLHVARDAFGAHPGLRTLLRQTFPRLRARLLERPSSLPAALSNAVEGQASRGAAFATAIAAVAETVEAPDQLLAAGVLLAWRLGDVRARAAALAVAADLPPRAVLAALDLGDWPVEAGPLALAALRADAWTAPRQRLADVTLAALRGAKADHVAALSKRLEDPAPVPLARWGLVSRVGDFSGFGGSFDVPPEVLDGGERHRLYARCGEATFRIEADVFGWSCHAEATSDLTARPTAATGPIVRRLLSRLASPRAGDRVMADGTLEIGNEKRLLPELVGTATFTVLPQVVAAARADSHRVRIVAPVPEPL